MGKIDFEIARKIKLQPIQEIAHKAGLLPDEIYPVGHHMAKILPDALSRLQSRNTGKLILVSAMTPTKAGEGKSTTTIGLSMALNRLGHSSVVAIREPSLGPCFGIKGGAAGGGWSQVLPMEDINLHFTGDLHATTAAHNLLSAMIDNHLHFGNSLKLDPRSITWRRILDMNDRSLRHVVVGLGGPTDGIPRETGFDVTVASEVMAVLGLSENIEDLRSRLAKIIIGYSTEGKPVTAADLKAHGAMAALLKHAINPNLVQTIEGTPALIHTGPFANIAHGCSSVIATKLALRIGEYAVTEAGFGFDLGGEKFMDIKCRSAGLNPQAVVIVATARALEAHGEANLIRHIENARQFNLPTVVAINRFEGDTPSALEAALNICKKQNVPAAISDVWANGSKGGEVLAREVIKATNSCRNERPTFLYENNLDIEQKVNAIVQKIYRGKSAVFLPSARKTLDLIRNEKLCSLPICMAKTQYSFSDNPKLVGAPEDFEIEIRELRIAAGAGFIVAITGQIMTMPGLPKNPAAEGIDIEKDGTIVGLF